MKVKQQPSEHPCTDFECLIGPFVDGELPVGEVTRLEEHFDDCAACQTLAYQFRSFDDLARSSLAEPPPVTAEEWGSMWENVQSEGAATRSPLRRPSQTWMVRIVAAAALLLFGIFVAYQASQFEPEQDDGKSAKIIEDQNELGGIVDDGDTEVPVIDFTRG